MKNFIYALFAFFVFNSCQSETTVDSIPEVEAAKMEFVSTPDAIHYYAVVLTGLTGSNNSFPTGLKEQFSEYHNSNFADSKLRISNIYLGDDKMPMLVIRRFQTETEANDYHQKFVQDTKSLFQNDWEMKSFPISHINYRTLLKSKSAAGYLKYYQNK
ncbi:hypothetical protein OAF63_00155 [Saprospiraceae bacterium]|jgi:hypothetical protein|nr:hypothetical protein [Saprospiraceae bacterium]MDF1863408.1 hypothetical protein [Saprospiraceae bacterium]